MRGEAANQTQQGNREYQPVCSSKMFTTIVDQPCEKEVRAEAEYSTLLLLWPSQYHPRSYGSRLVDALLVCN